MLALSKETERLAHRIAGAQNLSVDETVRRALEYQAKTASVAKFAEKNRVSDEEVARRLAAMEEITRQIDALPILDHRSVEEIVDEINEL